ncbi:MAG TPA: polysaccharide ABC transporter ATP-binding protein [Methylomirabilota bacterium]|nr:polysaccharide ABC transporter ATP-binding protein [Methylomirabilota bacterium]
MSTITIRGDGLSKRYQRGMVQSGLLRDQLAAAFRSPAKLFRRNRQEAFWALKDVSLEVKQGEVLGLIGRNGSGKTTLLKILSRITRPTEGWAEIHGRVGSLLEVGTGFHPELTGRENTYLSGAILGMSKQEISRKFDEIVAFAELEKFIDTPVKHYSSGMYVRLAFAVAAHLEPEILLVDEVLAVGDIRFQKKCLGKMGEVAHAGRTVILVTHQLNQIRRLCERVIWIDAGILRQTGPTSDVTAAYEADMTATVESGSREVRGRAEFLRWQLIGENRTADNILPTGGETCVSFVLRVNQPLHGIHHAVNLYDQHRQLIWGNAVDGVSFEPGLYELRHTFPSLPLRPGLYSWRAVVYEAGEPVDDWECLPQLQVATVPVTHYRDESAGFLNIPSTLDIRPVDPTR